MLYLCPGILKFVTTLSCVLYAPMFMSMLHRWQNTPKQK